MQTKILNALLGKIFNEEADALDGPLWSAMVILVAGLLLLFGIIGAALSQMGSESEYRLLTVALASWAVLSGACWNAGLKARAKNNLLLVTLLIFALCAYRGHYFG